MDKWEYWLIGGYERSLIKQLDQAGEEGWEAVGFTREKSGSYDSSPRRSSLPSTGPTGPLEISRFAWTVLLKRKK